MSLIKLFKKLTDYSLEQNHAFKLIYCMKDVFSIVIDLIAYIFMKFFCLTGEIYIKS